MVGKALLFLLVGVSAGALLLLEVPTLRAGILLGLAVWGFCRFYYFVFYVIEHYIDPSYRFSGLTSVAHYWISRKRQQQR
jgi:hypothetical protein